MLNPIRSTYGAYGAAMSALAATRAVAGALAGATTLEALQKARRDSASAAREIEDVRDRIDVLITEIVDNGEVSTKDGRDRPADSLREVANLLSDWENPDTEISSWSHGDLARRIVVMLVGEKGDA